MKLAFDNGGCYYICISYWCLFCDRERVMYQLMIFVLWQGACDVSVNYVCSVTGYVWCIS